MDLPLIEFYGSGPGPRRFYEVQIHNWWLLDIDQMAYGQKRPANFSFA
jgi:hypothetical protein